MTLSDLTHRVRRRARPRTRIREARDRLTPPFDFKGAPPALALEAAYQVVLKRHPDPVGAATYLTMLRNGLIDGDGLVDILRCSDEFQVHRRLGADRLLSSIHLGRCQFIRSLPPGKRIVDLGGTHRNNDEGAFVGLGYPYDFDELTIIDLPSDERHDLYKSHAVEDRVQSRHGPVVYRYHSMTDLSSFDDGSVDLFYSGQTIEHITREEGVGMLKEVHRALSPGGHIAIDTPNGRICRMQQEEFIDPDHKVEYRPEELLGMLADAGLEVVSTAGLCYAGASAATGTLDLAEAAGNSGIHSEMEDCYILCVVARK